ncbi:hypothetical protein ACOMHN_050479 [Nucella lapillus]
MNESHECGHIWPQQQSASHTHGALVDQPAVGITHTRRLGGSASSQHHTHMAPWWISQQSASHTHGALVDQPASHTHGALVDQPAAHCDTGIKEPKDGKHKCPLTNCWPPSLEQLQPPSNLTFLGEILKRVCFSSSLKSTISPAPFNLPTVLVTIPKLPF